MQGQNKQITYSSVSSPSSSKSPSVSSNSPYYNAGNKFSFSSTDNAQNANYSHNNNNSGSSPNFLPRNNSFRRNNNNNNQYNNQSNTSPFENNTRMHPGQGSSYSQQQQQNGISLYIKANNVTEDILKSIFNANVSQAKIISIDVKLKSAKKKRANLLKLILILFLLFEVMRL